MALKTSERLFGFEGVTKEFEWIYNNFGMNNLKAGGVKTEAPTAEQLDKGQMVISEVAGVPYVYYRTLAGTLYKKQMDAA